MGRIEQAYFGPQAGENEKQRQEQHDGHILDFLGHHAPETQVVGHDHSCQKSTEQRMDAEYLGNVGRKDQHEENESHERFAHRLALVIQFADLTQERAREAEHEQDVNGRQGNRIERADRVSRLGHGDHGREQTPRRHVVVRSAGDREHSHRRFAQVALLHDPGQYGKSRDADRYSDEQREREERSVMRPELGIDPICEHQPEKKRHDDARVADDERLARLTAHDAQIELHTDHEHEQHQADLADHVQRHERRRLEQELERAGKEMAQHGRPQHDSGHDLADHAGLTEILEQIGKDPDGNQNCYDLQQQQRHRVRQVRRQSLAQQIDRRVRMPYGNYVGRIVGFSHPDDPPHQQSEHGEHRPVYHIVALGAVHIFSRIG